MICTFFFTFTFAVCNYFFTGYEPAHVCAEMNDTDQLSKYSLMNDTTATIVYEMCQIRITSNRTGHPKDVASTGCGRGHSYQGGEAMTMKTEWGLVCEQDGVGELVQTMFGVGMVIGSVVTSSLPDKYGRKRVVAGLCVIGSALEIGISFSPSVYVVIALKFLSGTVAQAIGPGAFIWCREFVTAEHRERVVLALCVYWSVCMAVLGIVGYALSEYSWRVLQLVTGIGGGLPLLVVCFMDESLPWLFAKGRHSQALEILKKTCVKNGSNFEVTRQAYDKCVLRLDKIQQLKDTNIRNSTAAQYGFLDILFNRRLLKTTLMLGWSIFTHNLTYISLYLTSATFKVNYYFMIVIMASLEIPAALAFYTVLSNTKTRRSSVLAFLPTTAVCLLVSASFGIVDSPTSDHISNASVAFFILGKFSLDISYLSASCFIPEHYPTTLRNSGQALCNVIARIGVVFSPFLYPLHSVADWAPNVLLALLCLLAAGIHLLVPETKDRELPSTIMEAVDALPGSIGPSKGQTRRQNVTAV